MGSAGGDPSAGVVTGSGRDEPGHGSGNGRGDANPSLFEELLYCGFQTRFLEARLRELFGTEDFPPEASNLRADPRAVAIAFAMQRRADGTGDVCAPGPAAPGPTLAFGGTPLEFLRHVTGRGTGPNNGRGGGLGWTDLRHGLFGDAGPPGTMTQVMAGAALSFKQRKEARAAIAFESGSAANTGGWHEGLNLAAATRAPFLLVMTDDGGRRRVRANGSPHWGDPAAGYGVQLLTFSVEPLSQLLELVGEARAKSLDGAGPVVIRLMPLDDWNARWSCLDDLLQECRAKKLAPGGALNQVTAQAASDVEHAVRRLSREPVPDIREALGPVRTDTGWVPPWTRQTPVQPGNNTPMESPRGAAIVL